MNPVVELIPVVVTASGLAVVLLHGARTSSRDAQGQYEDAQGQYETVSSFAPGAELARRTLRALSADCLPAGKDAPVAGVPTVADPAPSMWGFQEGTDARRALPPAIARVLGCPRLLDADGQRVAGFRETALELLVYLVVHRDGVTAEAVLRDIYLGASPQRASERLATDLANLRSRLREAAGAGRDVNPVPRSRGRYRLLPDVVSADWWQVLEDWRLVKAATDERDLEAALRRVAAAYADGVLVDGAGYEWLADVQEQSRRLGVAAYVRLADLVASREQVEAAALLGRACDLDPFDEDLARRAIAACLTVGDRGAAASRCAVLQEALAAIDEEPEQETVDLMAHVI